jgi:hypothetical protein
MRRREALRLIGASGGAFIVDPGRAYRSAADVFTAGDVSTRSVLERLQQELPARAEVRTFHGVPQLFINGMPVFPLLVWTSELLRYLPEYTKTGFRLIHPWLSLSTYWTGPGAYDFSPFDRYMASLLEASPGAFFLPRVLLYAPRWWKDAHREELSALALPPNPIPQRPPQIIGEGGVEAFPWEDIDQPSYASEVWLEETSAAYRAFIAHVEGSPLRSRIIGYHYCNGISHEWHYPHSRFIPDVSDVMRRALGVMPDTGRRIHTTYGLLRDPACEADVIEYYRKFHDLESSRVVHFARLTKEATQGRVLAGAFFLYLLENVWIQEAGHLSPEGVLNSKDVDFIACPYTYESTSVDGLPRWDSDIYDDAGRWLGRARGVGGDGAFRVLAESLRRHGKLFFTEMDASTYRETSDMKGNGGSGSETRTGSIRIVERDLARMYASGSAGWFLDFGTWKPAGFNGEPYYTDPAIEQVIRQYMRYGEERTRLDLSPAAEVTAVYDTKSFFATSHWKQEEPFHTGAGQMDFFGHWFLDAQARTLHRMGTPVSFLYRFDLTEEDARRHKLIFMVNIFALTQDEIEKLRENLKGSGCTVVWFYAPGFIAPGKLDIAAMERLTGFRFHLLEEPGPMLIRSSIEGNGELVALPFGIRKRVFPRFSVADEEGRVLGSWLDGKGAALAMKEVDGWNSIYCGSAPLPVEILRWIARESGVALWSDRPDIVVGTRGTAALVATEKGKRTLRLPVPMAPAQGGEARKEQALDLDFGEVRLFITR